MEEDGGGRGGGGASTATAMPPTAAPRRQRPPAGARRVGRGKASSRESPPGMSRRIAAVESRGEKGEQEEGADQGPDGAGFNQRRAPHRDRVLFLTERGDRPLRTTLIAAVTHSALTTSQRRFGQSPSTLVRVRGRRLGYRRRLVNCLRRPVKRRPRRAGGRAGSGPSGPGALIEGVLAGLEVVGEGDGDHLGDLAHVVLDQAARGQGGGADPQAEGSIGLRVSKGIALRLTVIPTSPAGPRPPSRPARTASGQRGRGARRCRR